jgi:hypothetical protein
MAWVLKVAAQAAALGEEMAKNPFSHTSGTGGKSRAGLESRHAVSVSARRFSSNPRRSVARKFTLDVTLRWSENACGEIKAKYIPLFSSTR